MDSYRTDAKETAASRDGRVVLFVSFLNIAVVFGVWFSFSIFYVAILREFGLSRAYTAGIYSIGNLVIAVNAPLVGVFVDRYGAKVVTVVGALVLAAGLFLSSQITSIWQLYITYGIVTCLGISSNHFVPYSSLISNWFTERRGRALGIAFAGIGFGMMVISPLAAHLISKFGWRNAYLVLSLVLLFLTAPLSAFLQRNSPREAGFLLAKAPKNASAIGAAGPASDSAPVISGVSLAEAIRGVRFWHVFLVLMFCAMGMFTIMIHYVAYLTDIGFSRGFASSLFAILGLMAISSQVTMGALSDKYGREATFTAMIVLQILSIAALLSIKSSTQTIIIYVFPVMFGFGYGGAAPLFPAISSDIFSGRSFGKIYGMHSLGFNIGAAVGPWLAGRLFDIKGSYVIAFSFSMLALALASFFTWKAAPRMHRNTARALTNGTCTAS